MDEIAESKLLELNRQGIIPGPGEDETAFLKRADYCLALKENIGSLLSDTLPMLQETSTEGILSEAFPVTQKLFDIAPGWIPLFFSNYKLSPWHGGCAWIFQKDDNSPTSAFFQLRQPFRTQKRYLGLYDRSELIAHEMSHVGRMLFNEPQFEEFLAYRTATSKFRRWFGPILQSHWEGALFLLVLLMMCILDISVIGRPDYYAAAAWFKAVPSFMVFYALFRLLNKSAYYRKSHDKLALLSQNPNAVLYRLTDAEIRTFSALTPEEILGLVKRWAMESLRWRLIKTAYF